MSTQIEKQTKLALIINRIFGRCESGQNEIDVSGVAKVSEVDVDDNEFFDFDQIDLKNIDTITNNFKQNVIEYEDCGNVKFPVDNNSLLLIFIPKIIGIIIGANKAVNISIPVTS